MNTGVFVGIDVSQSTLDVIVRPTGEYLKVKNDPQGIAEITRSLVG
jgi:transposase